MDIAWAHFPFNLEVATSIEGREKNTSGKHWTQIVLHKRVVRLSISYNGPDPCGVFQNSKNIFMLE